MNMEEQVKSMPPSASPHVEGCEATHYFAIPKGVQAVIHIAGSDALVIVGNPNNGNLPSILTRSNGKQSVMRLENVED